MAESHQNQAQNAEFNSVQIPDNPPLTGRLSAVNKDLNNNLALQSNIENTHKQFGQHGKKMNQFQTMLALIASNIGGGIVGMPFAIYNCGAILGVSIIVIFALITQVSVILMLHTKDLTPRKYESLYEIGYILMGRWSIFIICAVLFMTNFGTVVLYFIIFGDTLGSTLR